ncbi:MAG: FAD-binding oxidoreductase [Candidatus Methanodesulfokora sp.]
MDREIVEDLRKILGKESVEDDELTIKLYSRDAAYIEGNALAVVFPKSTEEVSALLSYAYKKDLKIYPQGSTSELVGSSTPRDDGVILSLSRMDRIKEYSVVDMYAVTEPGVRLVELNETLAEVGYMFPIDPASVKSATVGGAVNSGAGGMMGLRYGTMKDAVLGLEIVLPDEKGTVLKIGGKTTKNRAGYDLVRLIVGSEGTLAVVTEATLKIVPMPENIVSVASFFPDLDDLVNAVVELKRRGVNLYIAEFLDAQTVEAAKVMRPRIRGEGNLLIISVDVAREAAERVLSVLEGIMRDNNASAVFKARSMKEAEEMGIFDMRRGFYPASIKIAAERRRDIEKRSIFFIEDISVPPSRLAECVKRIRELAEKYNVNMTLGGHIGDGNLHPNVWFEEGNEEEKRRALEFLDELMKLAVDLDGTVSSEHGIGTTKKEFLLMEMERKGMKAIEIMREIKRVFDPKGILNPGKLW